VIRIRRLIGIRAAITCAAVALASVAVASTAVAAGTPAGGATHLLVYTQEWSMWPSSGTIPAGTIDVELWNRGQDAHDLRVRRLNAAGQMIGRVDGSVRVTPSGAISHAVWHLKAGRYEIYCSLPGHLAMGMHADITVRRDN
jgi:plastocyanin